MDIGKTRKSKHFSSTNTYNRKCRDLYQR